MLCSSLETRHGPAEALVQISLLVSGEQCCAHRKLWTLVKWFQKDAEFVIICVKKIFSFLHSDAMMVHHQYSNQWIFAPQSSETR